MITEFDEQVHDSFDALRLLEQVAYEAHRGTESYGVVGGFEFAARMAGCTVAEINAALRAGIDRAERRMHS